MGVLPAAAQDSPHPRIDALGSEPQPNAQWRIGAFVGAAHNSPINPLLGQTPHRDHIFFGLQAQTTVLKIGAARVSWGVQLLPVVLIKGRSAPRGYYGELDSQGLVPGDNTTRAFGFSPFAIELAVPQGSRLGIFGSVAGGLIFFNKPFPVPEAKSSNFSIEWGGGVSLRVGRRTWLQAGYKYHHLSNAYYKDVNPGLDGHVGYLGFWKAIGHSLPSKQPR
jgi:hypothetical protein